MKPVLMVTLLIHMCTANIHSWGKLQYGNYKLYERILFDDINDVPKNYTIIHKYFGSYKPVVYFEINVNADSDGYVHKSIGEKIDQYDLDSQPIQIFEAKIHVNDAKNVFATLTTYGSFLIMSPRRFILKQETPKSITYVLVKNASTVLEVKSQNSIGQRRHGDELLYFESRNITNFSRFPSKSFEYSGIEANEYITYVGFSFDSPTAVAMISTSYVGEQEFNAVAYDMNTEHFVANMSVYGVKSTNRPRDFLGVI